jgi:hypothetical protein
MASEFYGNQHGDENEYAITECCMFIWSIPKVLYYTTLEDFSTRHKNAKTEFKIKEKGKFMIYKCGENIIAPIYKCGENIIAPIYKCGENIIALK